MKKYIAIAALVASCSVHAGELAKIQMQNDSYVSLTSLNCPFSKNSKPRFAYVVDKDDNVVTDACWTIVEDVILVVTRNGEVGKYPLNAISSGENKNQM